VLCESVEMEIRTPAAAALRAFSAEISRRFGLELISRKQPFSRNQPVSSWRPVEVPRISGGVAGGVSKAVAGLAASFPHGLVRNIFGERVPLYFSHGKNNPFSDNYSHPILNIGQ
jgi:hypothetical protein